MPLLGQGNRRLWRNTTAPQAENFGVSSRRYDLQLDSTYARAAVISGCRRPRWRRALLDAVLLPRALLRFSLFVPISASRFRRASARASRSLSGSLEERTNQQCSARASWFLLKDPFFGSALAGAAGFKKIRPRLPGPRYCVYWTAAHAFGDCR